MTLEEAKKRIAELDSGSGFLGSDYESGWEDALCRATEILDEIDTEPVGNPDKLTLTELAYELRKIFRFKYLAYGEMFYWGRSQNVLWISDQPLTLSVRDEGGEGCPCYIHEWDGEDVIETFSEEDLVFPLDLSEYKDADGNIDYSKCIVEVE